MAKVLFQIFLFAVSDMFWSQDLSKLCRNSFSHKAYGNASVIRPTNIICGIKLSPKLRCTESLKAVSKKSLTGQESCYTPDCWGEVTSLVFKHQNEKVYKTMKEKQKKKDCSMKNSVSKFFVQQWFWSKLKLSQNWVSNSLYYLLLLELLFCCCCWCCCHWWRWWCCGFVPETFQISLVKIRSVIKEMLLLLLFLLLLLPPQTFL